MKTALITGASSGIGYELAKIHAAKGGNLVLVARNKASLDELKNELEKQYKVSVYTIAKDLSAPHAAQEVYEETSRQNIKINYLINNAGFGTHGMFANSNWTKEQQMIQLNMSSLCEFTRLYVTDMLAQKSGKIMNVASTAAFQPCPTMAVYGATKAFVLSFTEAIANELSDQGVTVTALCPGATASGFQAAANMTESKLFKGKKLVTAKEVATYGYEAMLKGKAVAIQGTMNYILANAIRFTPRALVVSMARKIMS